MVAAMMNQFGFPDIPDDPNQLVQLNKPVQSKSEVEVAVRADFALLSLLKGDDCVPALATFDLAFAKYEELVKNVCQTEPVEKWAILKLEEMHGSGFLILFEGIR